MRSAKESGSTPQYRGSLATDAAYVSNMSNVSLPHYCQSAQAQGGHCDRFNLQSNGLFDAYRDAIRGPANLILLAAPPAFRPLHYQAAVESGKNAFLEKPCCVDAAGFRSLLATNKLAQDKGLKVGVGLAGRHRADYIEAMKRIHDGTLGPVTHASVYWNTRGIPLYRRAPGESELAFQIRNWRRFNWLSGEPIVHLHVSNLDTANWAKGDHPVAATGTGGCSARLARDQGDAFDHGFYPVAVPASPSRGSEPITSNSSPRGRPTTAPGRNDARRLSVGHDHEASVEYEEPGRVTVLHPGFAVFSVARSGFAGCDMRR